MRKLSLIGPFLFCVCVLAEEAPEPEYPQPKRPRSQPSSQLEQPVSVDEFGTYYYSNEPTAKGSGPKSKIEGVEAPTRVDADGTYHYGDSPGRESEPLPGAEKPVKKKDGAYFYAPKEVPKGPIKAIGEKPTRQDADGGYYYESQLQPATKQLRFAFGLITPPDLQASNAGGLDYQGVYGTKNPFSIVLEYDWTLFSDFYLKLGTGLTVSEGRGQFASSPDLVPKENFQLYTFPNLLSLGYRARTSQDPFFTPYVEGGLGYFTFLERRSDGERNSFGGAPVLALTGGLQISLSKYARNPALAAEYGIKQLWLDLQFRQFVGLDQRKDFTSSLITAGFSLGF